MSGCCGIDPKTTTAAGASCERDAREIVRERYAKVAEGGERGCCGAADPEAALRALGYTPEQAAAIPEGAHFGLGCGNPVALAALRRGETVLDLGSGAGIDCFLAAREVGPEGRAVGVDMTPAMVERARRNADRAGVGNVEFRLGEIENLPVADASVDVVISNCVVNLSPDKPRVFREAFRALRPGGRLVVSDLVLARPLPEAARQNAELLVGCVAGALEREAYLDAIRGAGFVDVEVLGEGAYEAGANAFPEGSAEREAFASVVSLKVRARRP
jgi:arsenite methyltransferase